MLNNLLKVGWKWKNADIICYILTSVVSLWKENVKNCKKNMKIEGENFQLFWTTWRFSVKFLEKVWLIILIKVTKKAGLHPLSRKCIFGRTTGDISNWFPSYFSVNQHLCILFLLYSVVPQIKKYGDLCPCSTFLRIFF